MAAKLRFFIELADIFALFLGVYNIILSQMSQDKKRLNYLQKSLIIPIFAHESDKKRDDTNAEYKEMGFTRYMVVADSLLQRKPEE